MDSEAYMLCMGPSSSSGGRWYSVSREDNVTKGPDLGLFLSADTETNGPAVHENPTT